MTSYSKSRASMLRTSAALAAAALTSVAAHATMGTIAPTAAGGFEGLTYGPVDGGNVFQFSPVLFIEGLGGAKAPTEVVALNPALSFDYDVNGEGTDLLTIDYKITNKGATAFTNLRFWAFANPDGDQTDYLDTLGEHWGAATATGPVARESQAFTDNPLDNILSRANVNLGLTDGPPAAACTVAAGCDAVFALQWNAASLGAGESFIVRVGLSDAGRTLSTRFLTASSVADPLTHLIFSGTGSITPAVPEPSQVALLLAGLCAVGVVASRRRVR